MGASLGRGRPLSARGLHTEPSPTDVMCVRMLRPDAEGLHSRCLSPASFSPHAAQERGLPHAGQGRADRWSDRQHQRGVLLGTGPPVAAQLHLQVQSDRRGGAEETVPTRVPQRLPVGGRVEKVGQQPKPELYAFVYTFLNSGAIYSCTCSFTPIDAFSCLSSTEQSPKTVGSV